MYWFAAAQQTSTVKLPAFFLRFQRDEYVPRITKSKITSENTINGYHFDVNFNNESSKEKKIIF